uniref:RNA-directed DNA polymerase n=1 Tax=Trichuris muris TaxID=70415 RepID=A0A5S6QMZ0_TRIMR
MINQLINEARNELPITAKDVEQCTKEDRILQEKRMEMQVMYGCLVWRTRIVILEALRQRTLETLHDTHPGRDRMVSTARQHCWWPGMDEDISGWISKCSQCARALKSPARAPLRSWDVAGGP